MSIAVRFLLLLNIFNKAFSLGIPEIKGFDVTNELIGNKLVIKCMTTGDAPFTYKWFFNGKVITDADGYKMKGDTLKHFETTKQQQGVYKCYASNKFGTVFNQVNVTLYYEGAFVPGSKESDGENIIDFKFGETARIECPGRKEDAGYILSWGYLPASGIPHFWETGREALEKAFITRAGTLVFPEFTQEDLKNINENKAASISCILYRKAEEAIQSIAIRAKGIQGTTRSSRPKLEAYMAKQMVHIIDPKVAYEELTCGAVGHPYPTITWYKDNKEIVGDVTKDGGNFTITGNGMRLNIQPVTLEVEGTYKCIARNSNGNDSRSGFLSVHEPPRFTRVRQVEDIKFEQNLTLTCDAVGIPALTFEWYHNNTKIDSSAHIERYTVSGNQLFIVSADFTHTGLYLCVVSNYIKIAVQPTYVRVGAIPPTLIDAMDKPTYVFKGYNNTISCKFKSAPAPKLFWYKDGNNITDTSRITVEGRGDSSLKMNHPKDSDDGVYKCKAENVEGEDEDEAEVISVVKTVITTPPQNLTLKVGKYGSIFCNAVYEKEKLKPTFQWLKDGRPIVENNQNVYTEKRLIPPARILFFDNVPLSVGNRYSCRVFTRDLKTSEMVSEDVRSADVVVIGVPMKPSELKMNGNCSKVDNITLSWKQNNYFGHKISYYNIEYAEKSDENEQDWTPYDADNKITTSSVTLLTDKLPPNANLKFRITAVLEYKGEKFTSQEVIILDNCKTPIGPPIVSPVVTATTEGPGTLVLTWDDSNPVEKPEPNYGVIVTYRELPGGENVTKFVNKTNGLVIPNAGVDKEYEVIVQSRNDKGKGPKSKPYFFKSGAEKITDVPGNVQYEVNKDNVSITWEPVQYARTYNVYYKKVEGDRRRRNTDEQVQVIDASIEEAVLTDLEPSQQYEVNVTAANDQGEGERSIPVSFKTSKSVPGVVGNVKVNAFGNALHITWQPPPSSDVESYVLTWYKSDEDPPKKFTKTYTGDASEAFLMEGLDPLAYYAVEITAVNSEGPGKTLKLENVVVSLPDRPGKPAPPKYQEVNETTMNMIFAFPQSGYLGGLPDNYTIYYYPAGGERSQGQKVSGKFPDDLNQTVSLMNGEKYMLYAVGINSMGESVPSDEIAAELFRPTAVPRKSDDSRPFYKELWFIILLILILLIIIIALIICCCMHRGGGKYPVGEKEKDRGGWDNQPLTDYVEEPYSNGTATPILKNGKKNGLVRSASEVSLKNSADDQGQDKDSLDDYGEDSKFNEDGSFIGQYGGENNEKAPLSSEINGATMV